jgi:hypothetical protein
MRERLKRMEQWAEEQVAKLSMKLRDEAGIDQFARRDAYEKQFEFRMRRYL